MTKKVVTQPKNSTTHRTYHYDSAKNLGKGTKSGKPWGQR